MRFHRKLAWFLLAIIACTSVPSQDSFAQRSKRRSPQVSQGADSVRIARAKFSAKKYDEAIIHYRRHLRRNPRDYDVWNEIGAAFYHTGLPKRGLRYLKHVERRTYNKSYNYYYQGLCYTASNNPTKAKEYFAYAATRFGDEYGQRSTFEMAAIEYNARDAQRAQFWLSKYLTRFPSGIYRRQATALINSLRTGKWIDNVQGVEKPDMEAALYKYNSLSFYEKPHYWFVQFGNQFIQDSGQEPIPGGGITASTVTELALVANAGAGIGPWKDGTNTAYGGYNYRQLWLTDFDRISVWQEDMTDIAYFPFRGDLMERRHQFYGDYRKELPMDFFAGVFGRYEFARIGSSIWPSPDTPELRTTLPISDTQLLIPWVGRAWPEWRMRTLGYLYMRKEINQDSPEHSNKTFNFSGNDGLVFSMGLSHSMDFPDVQTSANVEIFHYEFIYNDFWLDYTRQGGIGSVEHELLPQWYIGGLVGFYQDKYALPRIKQGACSEQPVTGDLANNNANNTGVNTCARNDTGILFGASVYWDWTQFQRFSGEIQFVENSNADLREYDSSRMAMTFSYTMAFPSVRRVQRYVDRFADSAFTKEAE